MLTLPMLLFTYCVGMAIGAHWMWCYMNDEWKRNPYRFKTIIDGVIALREARAQEQQEKEDTTR